MQRFEELRGDGTAGGTIIAVSGSTWRGSGWLAVEDVVDADAQIDRRTRSSGMRPTEGEL